MTNKNDTAQPKPRPDSNRQSTGDSQRPIFGINESSGNKNQTTILQSASTPPRPTGNPTKK